MHISEINNGYRVHVVLFSDNQWTERNTDIKLGHKYTVVGPLYSKQQKMLGKVCTVIDFIEDKSGCTSKAKVRYIDNNRVGRVSFYNLASDNSIHEIS